ncbi:hypothetical protein QMZ05_24580 [Bradyrhizobium sp. INPA03-11B]|uniref:hypothetical protein n=1 Tax=Bradyrhizobium sp. INPA03-11B TaxID=418598 RepID=UPI00339041F9
MNDNLPTSDLISLGREAWQRIQHRDKATFDDWIAIGKALIAGRQECMAKAGVNSPYGPAYQKLMRSWLDENGLAGTDSHERVGAIHCVEHQAEIESWRTGLTDVQRRRANHPNTILAHWRRGTVPRKSGPRRAPVRAKIGRPQGNGKPVFFDGDMIRRGAAAMRESRSADWFVLTRACLSAAIRSTDDLSFLETSATRRSAPAATEHTA